MTPETGKTPAGLDGAAGAEQNAHGNSTTCQRCGGGGEVVLRHAPMYLDVDDGYGPRLVGCEPTAWDYCDCPIGRKLRAEEDARLEAKAAAAWEGAW